MPVAPLEPASTPLPVSLRLTRVSPTLSPPIQVHNPSVSASSTNYVSQTSLDSVAPPSQLPLSSPSNDPPTRMHPMVTRVQNNIHQPKHYNDGTVRYPLPRAYTASLICDDVEPTSYTQAAKNVKWRAAMAEEFNAFIKTGTWTLVPKTASMNIVGAKWVFRIKRKADGSIDRYTARLVAKGFYQQEGVDYFETYSPVVKPIIIRTVLSLAVSAGWCIKQVDVSNAFLHGHLQETVYMSQPLDFVNPIHPDAVCLLKKALYGLKQAPRAWYHRLSSCLLELGFQGLKSDSSLFIFTSASVTILALVYVDDLILTGSSLDAIDELIHNLSRDFPMKDLGELNFFLGISVARVPEGLHLSQSRYISLHEKCQMSSPLLLPWQQLRLSVNFLVLPSVMLHFNEVLWEHYNISFSRALTLLLLSTKFLSLCMFHVIFIGLLSRGFCTT